MAWIVSSFGSSFVCFMKESFFTNIEEILYQFNTLCVQHMNFQLSGLQRNNKFFEILTHMDNEQHVCKCSLTCQDILIFGNIQFDGSIFPFKSSQHWYCSLKMFLQIFVLFDNPHQHFVQTE